MKFIMVLHNAFFLTAYAYVITITWLKRYWYIPVSVFIVGGIGYMIGAA